MALLLAVLPATAQVSFNRDIRPIMADTCFRCHGPDKNTRMANLRLDIREEALKPALSGAIPIVPGDPDKSAIVQRIFATKPALLMPPKYSHKELTEKQKQTIRQWVVEGARYEGHWAFQPVSRPPVPAVRGIIRNPIDAFVQARLAQEGLKPSPEADRRTLIRRVSLDLTGLPPTPEEMEAFVNDRSSDAYEKVVDRLLASPRFAEKQAMHWLDAVRYADTCGFHGDNVFPAWPYRDYVLKAFRDNKPFDQFTREQLAGDLLPEATREQLVASAYNRLNRTSAEGGIQPKEYLAKYASDRVRTTSSVWLGITMGCAECHDHKFDPMTAKDFYSMKAFFADIEETGLVPDKGPNAWGTKLALPDEHQARKLRELDERLSEASFRLSAAVWPLLERRAELERELKRRLDAGELAWRFQRPVHAASENGAQLRIYNEELVTAQVNERASIVTKEIPGNGLVVASGPNPDNETYIVKLKPGPGTWTALGIEVVQDESLPGARVARGADRFVLTGVEVEVSGQGRAPLILATSNLSPPIPDLPDMAAIDGNPKTGWGMSRYGEVRSPFLALRFWEKIVTGPDTELTVRLRHDSDYRRATIGRFRLALSAAEHSWPGGDPTPPNSEGSKEGAMGVPDEVAKALAKAEADRNQEERQAIWDYLVWASPLTLRELAEFARLEAERSLLDSAIPRVVVTRATTPAETRILPRGNWMDDSGEIVEPAIPEFLGKLETNGRRATRLDLANWIVSKENPLTARVFVNRMWRQFFGTGLSKVLDDLGSQGEWPTHPELLDWLASEFMDGWDVKRLLRTIVLSHTYRQASRGNPEAEMRDPDNRLLARQSRMRVDAEIVRDIALSVSGLLVEEFGGPSVRPYQPEGYLAALNFPKREYAESRGKDLYRRGLYTLWQRTFLHPSLAAFDAPSREECTVNRVSSNTPLQALVLLNDPIYVEAARVFAEHILRHGGESIERKIDWAFLRATGRRPNAEERSILRGLYDRNLQRFQREPAAALEFISAGEAPAAGGVRVPELAAMMTVARAILNTHETITRN